MDKPPRSLRRLALVMAVLGVVACAAGCTTAATPATHTASAGSATVAQSGSPERPTASAVSAVPTPSVPAATPLTPASPCPATVAALPLGSAPPYKYEVSATVAAVPLPELVRGSALIALIEVIEILPARWDTPDGQRPPDPNGDVIYRPVEVRVEQTLFGQANATICLVAYGGVIGQDSFWNSPTDLFEYATGERTVLFLIPHDLVAPPGGDGPLLKIYAKWVFEPDGRLRNIYPDRPFGLDYRRYTWEELLRAIALRGGGTATPSR